MTGTYEVIVIGGGAAGLSAALVLTRALRRALVVDAGEPRSAPAAPMHGHLSRDGMPPQEFLAIGREEIARYGVEPVRDRAVDVGRGEDFAEQVVNAAAGGYRAGATVDGELLMTDLDAPPQGARGTARPATTSPHPTHNPFVQV